MSDADRDRPRLEPRDEELVRRIAEAYRAPERSAERGAAFQRALEARLDARPRLVRWRLLAGACAAAAAAALLAAPPRLPWTAPEPSVELAREPSAPAAATAEEALLLLVDEPAAEFDDALPAEYVAIEWVAFGG
jgi:hypothetical protein